MLKKGQLNIQALIYHCQGPMESLKLLSIIANEASSPLPGVGSTLTSAGLLNLLHAK